MRTVKRNPFLAGAAAMFGALLLVTNIASAELGSDKSAAIIIFPKLISDTTTGTITPSDTLIQISNTASHQIAARCFLVNANSHCSNFGVSGVKLVCSSDTDCNPTGVTGGHCIAGWQETDFRFQLTPFQPIQWVLSQGTPSGFPLDGLIKQGAIDPDTGLPASNNQEPFGTSQIPPAPEQPFIGELKCVQVDPTTLNPTTGTEIPSGGTNSVNNGVGDLAGVATIILPTTADLDARSYNAIGLQATPNAAGGDNTLILSADPDTAEYDGCPGVLLLDHFFDGAHEPVSGGTVTTTLTLIPCSENFLTQDALRNSTVVQYLVYNEFEQRFSTSNSVSCLKSITISDIASRPGPSDDTTSIFNVAVQGTLTGQTRIRPVDGGNPNRGDGLLGIAEESFASTRTRSDAFNIWKPKLSDRATADIIVLP